MSFRKEYKFKTSYWEQSCLKRKFLDLGMARLHPKRTINSIYFDNKCLQSFWDSEEGVLPRRKIRLRFYNEESQKFMLETKISSVEGRYKISKIINKKRIKDINYDGIVDNCYGLTSPVLRVTYQREYYSFSNFRITFDENIMYRTEQGICHVDTVDPFNVIEVKCGIDTSDDAIDFLFDTPRKRFSKYSRGITFLGIAG